MSHRAYIFVRNDWNYAQFSNQPPEAIGLIHFLDKSVKIDRTRGSWWRGFQPILLLGIRRIVHGSDHFLFLFVLLLAVPLLAAGRHWGGFRGVKPSLLHLLRSIAGFIAGQSLALVIGGMGWWRLPGAWIEILIALTILLSAIHALRPWFAGLEPLAAGIFGLLYGFANATSIAPFGYSPWHMAMTILAFTLGVELAQIAIVLFIIPPLILLSRTALYSLIRIPCAATAVLVAIAWLGLRVYNLSKGIA